MRPKIAILTAVAIGVASCTAGYDTKNPDVSRVYNRSLKAMAACLYDLIDREWINGSPPHVGPPTKADLPDRAVITISPPDMFPTSIRLYDVGQSATKFELIQGPSLWGPTRAFLDYADACGRGP